MRHRVAGKQLSRNSAHRKALRRNLASSLIQHGAIKTTEAKAKELRRFVEKLITTARKGTMHARRRVTSLLLDREQVMVHSGGQNPDEDIEILEETVVEKLFGEIAPRYKDRPGGYTRIIRLPDRRIGDGGKQVIIQLVEEGSEGESQSASGRRGDRAARRHEAFDQAIGDKEEASTEESEEEGRDADVEDSAEDEAASEETTEEDDSPAEEPEEDSSDAESADSGEDQAESPEEQEDKE